MSETIPDQPVVTTDELGVPTATPQPKVIAATTGAGFGAAASIVLVYLIESLGHIDLPVAVEGAILVLVSAGASFLAGYIKSPSPKAS